ncbi:MAG: HEPN domain-containing protein [Defluviitaleaceae bacterium]|nr:HEPN domain-containing protein [Defluviitaleaceae bacterium]
MDFYDNAWETEQTAIDLANIGRYRYSVYLSCLASELYLKSKLHLVDHDEELETSHDVIKMLDVLSKRFTTGKNLKNMIKFSRKYYNESRYPYAGDVSAYTKDFAEQFLEFTAAVREYVENDCLATMDDLADKYSKD